MKFKTAQSALGIVLAGLVFSATAQADEVVSVEAYQAAIQQFGVDAAAAEQAAKLAVEQVEEMRKPAAPVTQDAYASIPTDFLDQSPYGVE